MKTIGAILCILFIAVTATAEVYFASRQEMFDEADVIAIVEITDVEKVRDDFVYNPVYSNQRAQARVVRLIRGDTKENISIFIPSFYPYAVATVNEGSYLVFLRRLNNELQGCNWHLSYRPIDDDGVVEWYREDPIAFYDASLDEVLEEIRAVFGQN